jgi:hypothetical protein
MFYFKTIVSFFVDFGSDALFREQQSDDEARRTYLREVPQRGRRAHFGRLGCSAKEIQ